MDRKLQVSMDAMQLFGKIVLVSGGSEGIGRALVEILQLKGAIVFSLDIREPDRPVENVRTVLADVANGEEVRRALSLIPEPIDVLINNAGVMRRGTVFDSTEEEFDTLFAVNVKGSWQVLKEARPRLRCGATIVQMCSRHALFPPKDPGLYALTKQAVTSFAEGIARDYPEYRVKLLFPGPVDTIGVGRFGVTGASLEEKIRQMVSPSFVASLIVALIESDKTRLLFDSVSSEYSMA